MLRPAPVWSAHIGAQGGEGDMHFDLARIAQSDAYKLLVSTVVPRPIALATTVDAAGQVNAAPFSFFNAVSSVPPVVVLGISPGDSAGDGWKDTERDDRRHRADRVEEAERRGIDIPGGVNRGGKRDRPRHDGADQQLVGVALRDPRQIEMHVPLSSRWPIYTA